MARGRKKESIAEKVRKEAAKIVEKKGEILLSELLRDIALNLSKKGISIRHDFATTSLASTPGLELRVTPLTRVKKIKINRK